MASSKAFTSCTCNNPWIEGQVHPCDCNHRIIHSPNTASDQRAMEQPSGGLVNGFDLE